LNQAVHRPNTRPEWPSPRFLSLEDGQRLLHLLCHQRDGGTVVQLVAATRGEGTSSLVRDLALAAIRLAGTRVLLLDLDPPGNRQLAALGRDFGLPSEAYTTVKGVSGEATMHRLAAGALHVSETLAPPRNVSDWCGHFPAMREQFDLVLIDSPAADQFYEAIMLAPEVDTSVLVVEAERTRAAVACNLRDRIQDVGGAIAGVLLNKRRFHVPDIINALI